MENRQRKFRAWDTEFKTMIEWKTFNALLNGEQYAYSAPIIVETIRPFAKTISGSTVYKDAEPIKQIATQKIYKGNPFEIHGFIVMDYSDLPDKTGKLICEGDIIRLGGGRIVQVKYRNGALGWEGLIGADDFIAFAGHANFNKIMPHIEIIGDIYRNPEIKVPNF